MRLRLRRANETWEYAHEFNNFLRIKAMLATTRATFCVDLIFFNLWRRKHGKRANGHARTGKTDQNSTTCACSFKSPVRKGYIHQVQCIGRFVHRLHGEALAIAPDQTFVGSRGQFVDESNKLTLAIAEQFCGSLVIYIEAVGLCKTFFLQDVPPNMSLHVVKRDDMVAHNART